MTNKKADLRATLRAARRALTTEVRRETDRCISSHITDTDAYRNADCILLYAAVGGEVDLSRVAQEAYRDGKLVGYPRVEGDGIMHFYDVRSLTELVPDAYGIPAPRKDTRRIAPRENTLMLLPALAIDHAGYRLGQGGGYYDRYLCTYPGVAAGIVREDAYLPTLPHEGHDQAVTMIITEKQIYKVK